MDKKILNNCNYNCIKQLSKQLELLWKLDTYIKDARECKHKDCQKVFEEIKKDMQKHAEILKELVEKRAKEGEFN